LDGLGSTDRLTDINQLITDSYIYKAFGELVTSSGSTTNPFQWIGSLGYYYEATLSSISLYSVRARWVSASIVRWLSTDPVGVSSDNPNLYTYVKNSSTGGVDPSGLCVIPSGIQYVPNRGSFTRTAIDLAHKLGCTYYEKYLSVCFFAEW